MDLKAATRQLSKDKVFKNLLDTLNLLDLPRSGNVYNELVKNIVYQQISFKVADVIYGRFIAMFDNAMFKPEEVLAKEFDELKAVGLSKSKTQYVINISQYFIDHNLLDCKWEKLSDDDITEMLTEIKGVGTWTVDMILIFELRRPDVFPVKDAAIQLAVKEIYKLECEKKMLITEMYKIAEAWQPHRSVATLYLWAWCRNRAALKKSKSKK
jgi:DNA-3-methyladenine glycosylase II